MRATDPTHPQFATHGVLNKGLSEAFNVKHFMKASLNPIGAMKKEMAPPGMGGTKWSPEVINRYAKATFNPQYEYHYDKDVRFNPKAKERAAQQAKQRTTQRRRTVLGSGRAGSGKTLLSGGGNAGQSY